jgi:hypothetical protein
MAKAEGGGRHCERCSCRVNDAGALTSAELDAVLERAEHGRVCLRSELVHGHPRLASGLAAGLLVVALAGCATPDAASRPDPLPFAELLSESAEVGEVGEEGSAIAGVVQDRDGQPLENAIVVLQSTALDGQIERMTNARGIYAFWDLPAGNYTIQVLAGKANVSKITMLGARQRFRANFRVDPEEDQIIGMLVMTPTLPRDASSTYHSSLVWIDD